LADEFHTTTWSVRRESEEVGSLASGDRREATRHRDSSDRRPVVSLDMRAVAEADLRAVDAVARFGLAAGRVGVTVRLTGCSAALSELFTLAGLDDLFALDPIASGGEARREPEQREELRGVKEERDLGDSPA
jgi:anti-anti-sigma regulatory factor